MNKKRYALPEQSEAGFTLLELLISMTLVGLLMAVVFGSLRFGAHAWERSEAQNSGTDEIRLLQTKLRHELERAYPFFVVTDPTRASIDFNGTTEELIFLAPMANALGPAARARIKVARTPEGDGMRFVLTERPELSLPDESEGSQTEVLLFGLTGLEFAYFGKEMLDESPRWHESWQGQTRLPQLIRMRAEFPRGDRRVWPELVIAPRISADVSCVFDLLAKFCRGR